MVNTPTESPPSSGGRRHSNAPVPALTTDPSNDRKSSGESLRGVPVTAGTRKFRHDDDDDQASFLPEQSQNRTARRGQHPPRTLGASSLEQPFSWTDGTFVGVEKVEQHEMLVGHGGVQVEAVKTTPHVSGINASIRPAAS